MSFVPANTWVPLDAKKWKDDDDKNLRGLNRKLMTNYREKLNKMIFPKAPPHIGKLKRFNKKILTSKRAFHNELSFGFNLSDPELAMYSRKVTWGENGSGAAQPFIGS